MHIVENIQSNQILLNCPLQSHFSTNSIKNLLSVSYNLYNHEYFPYDIFTSILDIIHFIARIKRERKSECEADNRKIGYNRRIGVL